MNFRPFEMIAEKSANDALILTDQKNWICEYSGLNPPKAALFSSDMAGMDGAKYQSSKLNTRNVVLTFTLLRDIPDSRLKLYEFFRTGQYVKLVYAGTRNVWIDGYVETISADQFKNTRHKEVVQVSILCYDPLLKSTEDVEIVPDSASTTFNYGGDVVSGLDIDIEFSGSVTDVILTDGSGNTMTVKGSFVADDKLHICTVRGKKAVEKDVEGTITNMIGSVQFGSSWLQLHPGENTISYSATSGDEYMSLVYTFTPKYEAV